MPAVAASLSSAELPRELPADRADDALLEGIRRGDRAYGKQLYHRLARIVDATLCRVVGPGAYDHDDLAQAVFEQVIVSIRQGNYRRRCSLTSWAASIACNVGLNAIRSRRSERNVFDLRQCVEDEALHTGGVPNPEQALLARDELGRLRRALSQMTEGRAEAVLLSDVLGYDLAEVANLTHCSLAAAESRLTRGRRELAERVAASESQEAS